MTSTPTKHVENGKFNIGDHIISTDKYRDRFKVVMNYGDRYLLHDATGHAVVIPNRLMGQFKKEF